MVDDNQLDRASIIGRILGIIDEKYPDVPIAVSLADSIRCSQAGVLAAAVDHAGTLEGCRRFAAGIPGYSGLSGAEGAVLAPILREVSAHARLEAVVMAAVCALEALGEEFDY